MTLKRTLAFTVVSSLLLCLQPGCSTSPPPTASPPILSELQRLQGTWEGVMVGDESHQKFTITITNNSFHFHRDKNFWFETTITLPAGTDPKQLHATIKDCADCSAGQNSSVGKVVGAIFKIEDGTLTLATTNGGAEETPRSFEATEGEGLTRYELRKIQPQGKKGEASTSKEPQTPKNNAPANGIITLSF